MKDLNFNCYIVVAINEQEYLVNGYIIFYYYLKEKFICETLLICDLVSQTLFEMFLSIRYGDFMAWSTM
jgi:hypothetical protein